MCGIAGVLGSTPHRMDARAMGAMLDALARRGPDDEGVWNERGVWLGHRRLSIVDLSSAGHQPMVSANGRFVITLNGEIYNHRSLRRVIEAAGSVAWRGHSDTEVLLEFVARFGIRRALDQVRGMFAFAVWDRREEMAYLARDRFGEKPLYYFGGPDSLCFASDLFSLSRAPGAPTELSSDALTLYFRFGYVPAPLAIHQGMHKLPPGNLLTWRRGAQPSVEAYWTLAQAAEQGAASRLSDPDAAVVELDRLLREAIGEQMMADVPVGVFLSGGIDSSLVSAIAQSLGKRPIKTFTLGFESAEFNEAEHALAVARHIGAEHTEHYVTAADVLSIVPAMASVYDEPFADASQIPTYLISGMARQKVTVCLTGDGGDELFAGYVRYSGAPRLWNAIRRWPGRSVLAGALQAVPLSLLEATLGFMGPLARQYTSRGKLAASLRKAAGWLAAADSRQLFELTMTAWDERSGLLLHGQGAPAPWRPRAPMSDNILEPMLWRDAVDYLPGDILCKVDRAAMACSLETRAPLLDVRIAEFAWRAPPSMKLRGSQAKWLFREVLARYLPRRLFERPKMGFSPPLHDWVGGPLREWAHDLLDPGLIHRQGLLNPKIVSETWRKYLAGDSSLDHRIWTLLMFQAWLSSRPGQPSTANLPPPSKAA